MKIGCVATNLDEIQQLAQIGYDYIELKGDLLLGSDAEFRQLAEMLHAIPIKIEALTSPLPRSLGIKMTGPRANLDQTIHVFNLICSRASSLGVQIVTIGCGQARYVDAGVSRQYAYDQICVFLEKSAEICSKYRIQAAVEHLNKKETNILNSIAETKSIVERVNRTEIRMLIDYYHILAENLSLEEEIEQGQPYLIHAHTATRNRHYPASAPNEQIYFLDHLINIGYNSRISVECTFSNFFVEASKTLLFMRDYLNKSY